MKGRVTQIVACKMINCALGPVRTTDRPTVRQIKLQFVICNSECRLIYSLPPSLSRSAPVHSPSAKGLEIKRSLMRKRQGVMSAPSSRVIKRDTSSSLFFFLFFFPLHQPCVISFRGRVFRARVPSRRMNSPLLRESLLTAGKATNTFDFVYSIFQKNSASFSLSRAFLPPSRIIDDAEGGDRRRNEGKE